MIRFSKYISLLVTTLLLQMLAAHALDFGSGPLPRAFEPDRAVSLPAPGRIVIDGAIEGTAPVRVVLRIDDGQSKDYASRMNDERVLPPGPFTLAYDTATLRTENGRTLNAADIRRVIFFVVGDGRASVSRFATVDGGAPSPATMAGPLPQGTAAGTTPHGFSFGTGTLPLAFEPAAPVVFEAAGSIDIAGTIAGTSPVTVVLRIDDGQSSSYASRMNDERVLPPGPFALRHAIADLRTSDGRALDPSDIRRVILFVVGPGQASVNHFVLTGSGLPAAGTPAPTPPTPPPTGAAALDFGRGPLPIAVEPAALFALPAGRIDIAGTIAGTAPANLVLRIDDDASTDYLSRMNDERTLQPGPFQFSVDTRMLRASGGRVLDPTRIRRIILFVAGVGQGTVSRFTVTTDTGAGAQTAVPAVVSSPTVDVVPATQPTPATPGTRVTFGSGRLPIQFDPGRGTAFSDTDEIRVEGVVDGTAPAAIALRVDDTSSAGYPTRYNDERMIPPGPFRFAVGLKGLKTPSGRVLDPARISRVILFAWSGAPQVTITRFETAKAARLPAGARGYSFGALDAAVLAGFERVGPADPRLIGRGPLVAVRRPAPDPLVANGIRGVRRVVLPAPAGRVRVTVWSEDPGEWDLLPHPLDRRIQVNGRDLLVDALSADTWIAERYLAGARIEHSRADDAWTAYGSKRGNARAIDVDVTRDGVTLEISGSDTAAYYLGAVLIEPISDTTVASQPSAGQQFVEANRALWYRSTMPVAPTRDTTGDGIVALPLTWSATPAQKPVALHQRAAPDTAAGFKLAVTTDRAVARPRITIQAPTRNGIALPVRLWGAQRKLERDDTVLRLADNRLLADTTGLALTPETARGYEMWIDVPRGTPAGAYAGAISFGDGAQSRSTPIEITVLSITLPPIAKPAGFYLARAAHLATFPGLTIERERQVECDLAFMRGFGMSNTAPPIGGLDRSDLGVFANDMRRAQRLGVSHGWLIYNPLHDLVAAQGAQRSAEIVGRLEDLIRAQGLPQPLWSVADEPSNADQASGGLGEFVKLLRQKARGVRLAGHLNAPGDEKYAALFDTVLLNAGFGIDAAPLERMRKSGKGVWLYNTFAPRQTAGLWLWRSAAERYVQWHGRLPTADPFDPIDGREADFQMLYPMAEVCARQPDIHRDLLRMAEGLIDQRWLLWLDANTTPAAKSLAAEIRSRLPGAFADAKRLNQADLDQIRAQIMDLATR